MKNQNPKLNDDLHKNLDKFIQQCLNKFQFVDPKKNFYDITGEDQNLIISHKSTIPDLVIWNKTFNKNNCFEDSDSSKITPFPRFKFFLRFNHSKDKKKSNKKSKNKSDEKSNNKNIFLTNEEKKIENTAFTENDPSENISNAITKLKLENNIFDDCPKNHGIIPKESMNNNLNNSFQTNNLCQSQEFQHIKNCDNNFVFLNCDNFINNRIYYNKKNNFQNNKYKDIINGIHLTKISSVPNNKNQIQFNYYQNNFMNSTPNFKNKNILFQNQLNGFAIPTYSVNQNKKIMNNYYQNQFKQNELLMNFVFSFLEKKGWIVFKNNANFISTFTSFELFSFLTSILEKNNDLKVYLIRMNNSPMSFNGEQIYIILSQTLPIILQQKQYELMQREKIKNSNLIKENLNMNNESNKENDYDNVQNIHDEIDYKNENSNMDKAKNRDDSTVNDEEENYFNLNLYDNNLFINQRKENISGNIDSSIFGQYH